jgi:hypothetical protein
MSLFRRKPVFIGEVYVLVYRGAFSTYIKGPADRKTVYNEWRKFTKRDITDEVGDRIKIFNVWLNKSDIFYYADIYSPLKRGIEKGKQDEAVNK